jgi:hypothetical protein
LAKTAVGLKRSRKEKTVKEESNLITIWKLRKIRGRTKNVEMRKKIR